MTIRQSTVVLEVVRDAIRMVRVQRGRNLLALLGVAIGAAAVVAMLHAAHTARAEALQKFQALDWNLIMISPEPTDEQNPVVPYGAEDWLTDAGIGIEAAASLIQTGGKLRAGRELVNVTLLLATDAIYQIADLELSAGRSTSALDGTAPFAVVGRDVADQYYTATARTLQPGNRIAVNGHILTVVGLLRPTPVSAMLAIDMNSAILVPFAAARRVAGGSTLDVIVAELAEGTDDRQVSRSVRQLIEPRMETGYLRVHSARQVIESIDAQMRIYAILIVGIGSVSLFVGGVGIMNVMLMNVMERRQEIGLRQAIGARRAHIRIMFLTEAIIQASLGSMIGTAVGYLGAWLFAETSSWQFHPSPMAPILGAGMALTVGLLFGVVPAERAARLDPVTALRSE